LKTVCLRITPNTIATRMPVRYIQKIAAPAFWGKKMAAKRT
jgi:hypothetical protein